MHKALIIDDDPIFHYIADKIFKKTALFESPRCVNDVVSALKFLDKNKDNAAVLPDIILLDLYMPYNDGWEFLNRYEEFSTQLIKTIPVYIMTSSIDPREIARSEKYDSVKAFQSKPLTYEFIQKLHSEIEYRNLIGI